MTDVEKNRKVAEACFRVADLDESRYEVYDADVFIGGVDWDDYGPLAADMMWNPLHDANQAIAALVKVFGDRDSDNWQEGDGWSMEHEAWDVEPFVCATIMLGRISSYRGPTFCAAAVNAILAAKGLA